MPREFSDFEVFVRVDPEKPWYRPKEDDPIEERLRVAERRCNEIVRSVGRHVDDIEGAYVQVDREYACSYCDNSWTEDSTDYNGGCCDEDEGHNPALTSENNGVD